MRIKINGHDYRIPTSLMDITLQQRVEFDSVYGKGLAKQLNAIRDMPDDIKRELEFTDYHLQLATKTVAFFAKIPLEVVEQTQIEEVLTIYHHSMKSYSEDIDFLNKDFNLTQEIHWMNETWVIAPPHLKHDSTMAYGEFLDAKQIVKNLFELGDEKWTALISLACIYLRKKDEEYEEELIRESGPRYQLMKTLPLQHALHVGFFLSVSMNLFLQTSPSFSQARTRADLN